MSASTELNEPFNSDNPSVSAISHEDILNSVRQLLKNQVFSGRFEERRLIEIGSISMYKDIIVIEDSEQEFMKVLKNVNDILTDHFQENIITCISANKTNYGTTTSYSIWTNLNGVTLGGHWFQVKNISLFGDVFHISLKSLRPLKIDRETTASVNFDNFVSNINLEFFKQWFAKSLEYITLENTVAFSRFLVILFVTFAVGCYHLLELLLRGLQEVNVFVHNITPVLVACVNGITKIIGGFFLLIAMLWNGGNSRHVPHYPPPRSDYLGQKQWPMLMNHPMNGKRKSLRDLLN